MPGLNTEQWKQARELFDRAAELAPEERQEFLERECRDGAVRAEVASLLEHAGEGLPFAGQVIAALASVVAEENDPDQWLIGAHLGPYRVEAIVGHGGMGAVYRAERDDAEFRLRVAIKLVRAAAASPATLSRFKQERQILARLSHPYIAHLLDGGSTPEGVPYLVMEFVEGEPISAWCEQRQVKLEDRLRLFAQVCEGVEHAHHGLIVHRDLKPANILVTQDGTPKLLDFGIAKLLDSSVDTLTKTGLSLMTPDYASPEQVRGDPVTPAADVYALGLILYELLTGVRAQQIPEYTPATIAKVVCQDQAAAPASLRPQLAGDLDNIIRMALRKEPERRYGSAGDLGRDIQRHLERRPVMARPDTLAYRWGKFVRRNRVAVAAGLVILASLAGGIAFSVAARRGAGKRVPRVAQVTQLTQTGRADIGYEIATDGVRVYFTERKGGSWSLSQVGVEGGTPQPVPAARQLAKPDAFDVSPDNAHLLVAAGVGDVDDDKPLWLVPTSGGSPRRLGNILGHAGTWSRDGSKIIYARGTGIYQTTNEGTNPKKLIETGGYPDAIRWSPAPPDVLRFQVGDAPRRSALWEAATDGSGFHRMLKDWKDGAQAHSERDGVWTSAGKYYFFQSWHGPVAAVWAMREGRGFLPAFDKSPVQVYSSPMDFEYLAATADGKRILFAAGQDRRELMRYDGRQHQFVPYLPGVSGRYVSYSKDGQWQAYTTFREGVLWRCHPDGSGAVSLTGPSVYASLPRWSPDGARIAFTGEVEGRPNVAYVIPSTGGTAQAIPSTEYIAGSASWSPDGGSVVFGVSLPPGARGQPGIYVYDWTTRNTNLLPGSADLAQPAWSPDGRYIAAHRNRTQLLLFDVRGKRWTSLAEGAGLGAPYWSSDGRCVYFQEVFGGPEEPVSRVQIATRKVERLMGLAQIPQSNVTGYLFGGLAPGDAPIASVIRTNSDIYSLELELP